MKYDVTKGGYILLGRCGENLARTVEIDVSEYLVEYPGAVVTLLHRRHGESGIYPVAAELRDGCLIWQPTSADTAIAGSGEAEVRVTVNGVLAKSKILSTMVDKSLTGQETDAPEPGMDWVDKITAAIGSVQNMKAEAESVAYDEPATAEYDGKTGTMKFGIPEGKPGRDASVTAENIQSALGYTSADKVVVDQLTQEIVKQKAAFENIVDIHEASVNLYEPQTEGWLDEHFLVTSGYPMENPDYYAKYCVTPHIPINGGRVYTITPRVTQGVVDSKNRIRAYDAAGVALGVLNVTQNTDGSITFPVPDSAKTIRLSVLKSQFDFSGNLSMATTIQRFNATVMLIEGTNVPSEYVPYYPAENALKNIDIPDKSVLLSKIGDDAKFVISPLLGKKIANFGDSVFGNARPPQDVSTFLAENTGATVYNCAFGGCRMAVHSGHWDAFSMYRLAYSIANNDYAVQDEAINYDDRTSYAEEPLALMKTIDYSALDILTIGYGTNDFTGNNRIDNADNPLDTSTVCGALRYSIETLLTAYPNLRVFVLLPAYRFWMDTENSNAYVDDAFDHVNSLGKTLVEYNAAIAETSKAYNIPVIDNFAELGINKVNRQQYFPATDGTHHNENGRKLLAKHIAAMLW